MADSDAMLTDHEWRLKMAAEGKAVYIPGKTADQVKEEMAAKAVRAAQPASLTITLAAGEWSALDTAIQDLIGIVYDVKETMRGLTAWDGADAVAATAFMRLATRALESMEEKEIDTLDRLDSAIRRSQSGRKS